jgi:4-amino-4-deoxy-L-arabinose transferase-like glycosyltransferase
VTRKGVVVAGLVSLALLARAIHLLALRGEPLLEFHHVYTASDMYLFDQWARRIVAGDWLGREVYHPLAQWQLDAAPLEKWERWYGTTPVFYKAPFYAYLIALLQLLFGDAMLPVAVLQIGASAVSVALLVLLTERTLGWEPAVCAGLLLALYAPDIHYDAVMLRGPWIVLAALLVAWRLLRLREEPSLGRAVLLGAAVGAALLVNEGFSVLLLLVLPWLPARARGDLLRLVAGFAVGIVLVVSPLVARNLAVGAPPFRLAVTTGMGIAVHNSAGSSPFFYESRPAAMVPILERSGGSPLPTLAVSLRSFGTPWTAVRLYLGKLVALVVPFESPDNANIYYAALESPLLRLLPGYGVLFPLGALGLVLVWPHWKRALVWLPPALALLAMIALTMPLSRYRTTFAVFLVPFAGLACASWVEAVRRRHWRRAAILAAAALALAASAQLLQRFVVFADRPADNVRYRPAEFVLSAQVHAGRHDLRSAAHELVLLARLDPRLSDKVNAYLLLADLAAGGGDPPLARAALARAARLGRGDASALLAVGDAYRTLLRDSSGALAVYRAARRADAAARLGAVLDERIRALESVARQPGTTP